MEPLAVDAHHRSHGHEGFGVDRLHELEDHRGLALAADHHHDLRLLFGVPPLRVDERHAAVDIVYDGLRHLLIVVRDDEYLARLLVPGHDHVDRIAEDRGHHVAVDHRVDMEPHEHRGADDHEVRIDDDLAVADRAVLVDNHGGDARRAALHEADRHADTRQDAAQDHRKDPFQMEEIPLGQHRLPEIQPQRYDADAEHGLHAEVPSDDEPRHEQQHAIDQESHRTDLDTYAGPMFHGMAQHARKARGTASGTVGGHDASDPCKRVQHHADRHQEVLLEGFQHLLHSDGFHSDGY